MEQRFGTTEGNMSAFARAIDKGKAQNVVSQISAVLRGDNNLPKKHIATWAKALGLEGKERDEFEREALLAHAPAEIQSLVVELRDSLAENAKYIAARSSEAAELRAQFEIIAAQHEEILSLLAASGYKLSKRPLRR